MSFRNDPRARRELGDLVYYVRKSVKVDGKRYHRRAIQTHFVQRGESYLELISKYVLPFYDEGDILSISEKIMAMCQNNVVERKDVKVGFWAKFLSRFASQNSYGIGFHESSKFQLIINTAGLPRVLFAVVCSAITKLFGKRGVFYEIIGHDLAGIDGFYEGSAFEIYKDLALFNPKDPEKICNDIYENFGISCMIVDANDLDIQVLAKCDALFGYSSEDLIPFIKDNPSGQSDELTPLILIKPLSEGQDDDFPCDDENMEENQKNNSVKDDANNGDNTEKSDDEKEESASL